MHNAANGFKEGHMKMYVIHMTDKEGDNFWWGDNGWKRSRREAKEYKEYEDAEEVLAHRIDNAKIIRAD
jgi:hypothetical protein